MSDRKFNLHNGKTGAAITVRIQPRASQNEIHEILSDGTVKIYMKGTQNDEKTNQALIGFLSRVLEVEPTQLEIVAGQAGNDKLITILDLDKALVQERILKQVARPAEN